jgi:hypothetical protein
MTTRTATRSSGKQIPPPRPRPPPNPKSISFPFPLFLFLFSSILFLFFVFSSPSFLYFVLKIKKEGPWCNSQGIRVRRVFDFGPNFREPPVLNFGEGASERAAGSGFCLFLLGEESEAKNRRFELFQKPERIVRFHERTGGFCVITCVPDGVRRVFYFANNLGFESVTE